MIDPAAGPSLGAWSEQGSKIIMIKWRSSYEFGSRRPEAQSLRAGRPLGKMIFGTAIELMVRGPTTVPAAQSVLPPFPTPNIGGAVAPEQVPAAAYPHGVQVPVIVNHFYTSRVRMLFSSTKRWRVLLLHRRYGGPPTAKTG